MLRRLPEEGEVIMSEDTIERMHDELEEANKWKDNFEHDAAKAKAELSTAYERIAYLEALVAVNDELLTVARCPNLTCDNAGTIAHNSGGSEPELEQCQFCFERFSVISASAETVQAFRDKLTEPLRREVAYVRKGLEILYELADVEQWYQEDCACVKCHDYRVARSALSNTQATAIAYEREVEARGAVKALEDLRTLATFATEAGNCVRLRDIDARLFDLRATTKKEGK